MRDAAAIAGFVALTGGVGLLDYRWAMVIGGALLLLLAIWGHVRT